MNPGMNAKYVVITPPAAIVDNASITTASVDTRGFDYAVIRVMMGATDIAMSALKVQESNDDGSTDSYADVTGLVFGTSTNLAGSTSAVPSATDDNKMFAMYVDLRGRKRYLDLVATGGDGAAGAYFVAWAELYRGEGLLATTAARGFDEELLA